MPPAQTFSQEDMRQAIYIFTGAPSTSLRTGPQVMPA